jgi:acyl dehydratase
VLHGEQEFRYHRMAYAGDELTARARFTDVYSKKGGALQFLVKETTVGPTPPSCSSTASGSRPGTCSAGPKAAGSPSS